MRSFQLLGLTGYFATSVLAGLVAVRSPPPLKDLDLLLTRSIHDSLHGRQIFPAISLGKYDLTTSAQNEVLFDLTQSIGTNGGKGVGIKVTCVDCRTWGSAIVSTTGAEKDNDIIGDIIEFFQDPAQAIIDAFSVDLKLELSNVGGHFEFDIDARAALSYSIPIFQSLTPLGGAIGDDISIGVVFSIELVFSVDARIDLSAGFDFSFPENTYIIIDPLTGQIKEDGFLDGEVDPLPITVISGTATFKAALKATLQAGTEIDIFGTGFDFQLGVFANIIEYIAIISTSPSCPLSITHSLNVNIGAFADHVIKFSFITIGGSAPFVTTILALPLPSLCIAGGSLAEATPMPLSTVGNGPAAVTSSPSPAVTLPGGIFNEQPTPLSSSSSTPLPIFTLNNTSTPPLATSTPTSTDIPISTLSNTLSFTTHHPTPPISAGTSLTYPNTTTPALVPAPLITSTIYTTSTLTLGACASPLINCPTSLATTLLVTSTRILYTTVCPLGAVVPTTLPTSLSTPAAGTKTFSPIANGNGNANVKAISAAVGANSKTSLHLVHLATPIVETIYKPTFAHLSYTLPTNVPLSATASPLAGNVDGVKVKLLRPTTSSHLVYATGAPSHSNGTTVVAANIVGDTKTTAVSVKVLEVTGSAARAGGIGGAMGWMTCFLGILGVMGLLIL